MLKPLWRVTLASCMMASWDWSGGCGWREVQRTFNPLFSRGRMLRCNLRPWISKPLKSYWFLWSINLCLGVFPDLALCMSLEGAAPCSGGALHTLCRKAKHCTPLQAQHNIQKNTAHIKLLPFCSGNIWDLNFDICLEKPRLSNA